MTILVWPFFAMLVESLAAAKPAPTAVAAAPWDSSFLPRSVYALMLIFLVLLLPMKSPPRPGDYAFASQLENAVRADLQAGRKVLVAHSTEVLIHSGVTEVPRDRSNTILELSLGGLESKADMASRINAHYYDRIYLLKGDWYGDAMLDTIDRNYSADYEIKGIPYKERTIFGDGGLMGGCLVLSPRKPK